MNEERRDIIIAVTLSIVTYILGIIFLNDNYALLLAILVLLVSLWINEGLHMGVVSALPLVLFPAAGLLDFGSAVQQYASPIVFMFVGGFLLALAMQKIGLHEAVTTRILSLFPNTPRGIIYSFFVTAAILSAFLSNTTTTIMLLPVALFLTQQPEFKKRLLVALAFGASVGGILTPIGTPPNLIFLEYIAGKGIIPPTFFQWMVLMAPLIIMLCIIVPFIISLGMVNKMTKTDELKSEKKRIKLTFEQKKLGYVLVSLFVLLIVNSPMEPFYSGLGLNEKWLLFGFGILMFLPGFRFLEWKDVTKIPFHILLLFGAGLTIAAAVGESGVLNPISSMMGALMGLHLLWVLLIIIVFVIIASEVSSNTALIALALPVVYTFAQNTGVNPLFFLLVLTIAASYGFMLPIATPPNTIVMSSNELKPRFMIRKGIWVDIAAAITLALTAYYYWQMFAFF